MLELGPWAAFVLILGLLLWFFGFTPLGKAIQERIGEWWKTKLAFLRPAPPPPAEIQRREVEYLDGLLASPALKPPDEAAAQLDAYLRQLQDHEPPLYPSEEKIYVPLAGGLDLELKPAISLHRRGPDEARRSFWQRLKERLWGGSRPVEANKMFAPQRTFKDLTEAVDALDDETGAPHPVLVLLGEPGAGKSTLLRKFARRMVEQRLQDPAAKLPIFVSLGAHKSGNPLAFLRQAWIHRLGFDGLEDALAAGRVWLFADGLNEMPRAGYESRMAQWGAFLKGDYFTRHGNRALAACRVTDYGAGVNAPKLLIHPMDDERILDFLKKRIPGRAEALMRDLEKDRDEGRGKIYQLAQIPFWLVMLARLPGKGGLPRNRAALVDQFVAGGLDYENSRDVGRELGEPQREGFRESLTALAWIGLARSQNYTFALQEARKIVRARQGVISADDLQGLGQDCSLLVVEADSLRFQHQLFQEFFAARELARRFAAGKNLRAKWRTPWRRWKFVRSRWDPLPYPPQTNWEEAFILAAGMLGDAQAERLALAAARDNRPLAARIALESGAQFSDPGQDELRRGLLEEMQSRRARLPARLAAGRALAKL
ncbi:MAG: hypothetical protein L0Z70_14340, partial [Chloroflexi bacterium]|nr:hypothetical protein [Chloroflexota bacterium]